MYIVYGEPMFPTQFGMAEGYQTWVQTKPSIGWLMPMPSESEWMVPGTVDPEN